jgi:hypothetical protein
MLPFLFPPFFYAAWPTGQLSLPFFYKKALRPAFFFFAFSFLISLRMSFLFFKTFRKKKRSLLLFSFLKLLENKKASFAGSLNIRRAIKKKRRQEKKDGRMFHFFF